jgi:DNA-binding HxlR family transcriptional regulator
VDPRARLYGCPVELTLDLLGGKWKTVILARLKQAPLRYGELRSVVPGLADKMLTQRLRDLEKAGFVERVKKED